MAGSRIKGITIEIDGNTTKLQTALSGVNKDLRTTQSNLRDVNNLLEHDPTNMDLLKQKQELLTKAIDETKQKIDAEKEALRQLKEADQTPEVVAQQEALERQIVADESALENLEKESGAFQSAGAQAFFAVGEKVKECGEKIKNVGEDITKNVTVPLAAIGAASIAAFKSVDDGYDEMIKKTGATGEEAEALRGIMENLATSIPTDFKTAGEAVGEVATRFGLTGQELEDLSGQFIKFADLNNTDVSTSVDKVQKAMAAYGLSAEDASAFLDTLNKTGQDTGISVDKLSDGIVTNGAAFQEMGLTVDQAVGFMGKLEKSGVDSNTALKGMRKALKNATKDGKPMNQALKELQETIKNGTGDMDGLTAAYELFGSTGDQIYAAVQNGTLDFEEFGEAASGAGGSVSDTFEETQDPIDQFQTTLNQLKIVGAELGAALLETLAPILEKVGEVLRMIKEKWDALSPGTQEAIVKAGLIAAAIGPVITIVGTLVTAIGALMSPIGLVVVAIAAAVAAGVLLYKNWDKICAWAAELKDKVIAAWNTVKEKVTAIIDNIKAAISEKWDAIKNKVFSVVETIKSTISEKWTLIKNKVTEIVSDIKQTITEKWDAIKSKVIETVDTIKSTIIEKFSAIKTTISSAWSVIKETTSYAWGAIKDKIDEHGGGILGVIGTLVEGYTTLWSGMFDTIDELTGGKLSDIYNWFEGKFSDIYDFISGIIEKIKGIFNFEWSLPELKLPHIVVERYIRIPVLGTIPDPRSMYVEWYKKAYDTPYLFTDPTIVGGRGFGDGGGSGEIVYGRDQLMRDIAEASQGDITINVYPSAGMDERALAELVSDRLALEQRQKAAAYA